MGLERRTVKIIVIVAVVVLIIGLIIGILLGVLLPRRYVQLEVWPRSDAYNYEEPLIHFRASDPGTWQPWYQKINDFLAEYETTVPEEPPRAPCSVRRHDTRVPAPNCERALTMWSPCNADHYYGYQAGTPCIFLRLNHIHYWVPEPYNVSVPMDIPHDMPQNIKRAMKLNPAREYGDFIWVSCKGEFSSDEENIGPIQYLPGNLPPGFPTSRLRTYDRLSPTARSLPDQIAPPVIAVLFERPNRGILINVECRIWTRDIVYDHSSRVGRVRFEIKVE